MRDLRPEELPPAVRQRLFQLTPLGPIAARRMFSTYGLFLDDLMFALFRGERIFLKADRGQEEEHRRQAREPFTYRRQGRIVALCYWSLPVHDEDDPEALLTWGEAALASARRETPKKRRTAKRKTREKAF